MYSPQEPLQLQRQDIRQLPILIGSSEQARQMRVFAEQVAGIDATVLIRGETGTGKDLFAELIHSMGRASKEFVPVDCGALNGTLPESELFGHQRGAFTDAHMNKLGLVEVANGGTLFLSEVANAEMGLQARLLRISEKRSFRAVGGVMEKQVRTRLIVATNADLEAMVTEGRFREDLYHRLNVLPIHLAPLHERQEDIPELAAHFLSQQTGGLTKRFTPEALVEMSKYHWPGNVRELQNVVARANVWSTSNIRPEHLSLGLRHKSEKEASVKDFMATANDIFPTWKEARSKAQEEYLRELIAKAEGNVVHAAKMSGITRSQLYKMLEAYDLMSLPHETKAKYRKTRL